jgi:hypothetical protein
MVNTKVDTQIVISKELKTRIKIAATKDGRTMKKYLETIVPK